MPTEPEAADAFFPLREATDRPFIDALAKAVRRLVRRAEITAEQLHHLAVLLHGLERLPAATPGLDVTLSLVYERGGEMSYKAIDLDAQTFELSAGGSVYDPSVGSDSYGDDVFMVETSGYRDGDDLAIVEWLMGFKERTADATIRLDLDEACEVDWSDEPDPEAWQRAAERFDAEDGLDDE